MIYYIDIDGILCTNTHGEYENAQPILENIAKINKLYEKGEKIVLWTARGSKIKRKGLRALTEGQLEDWGVKHHELVLGKPFYDFIIDDKTVDIDNLN